MSGRIFKEAKEVFIPDSMLNTTTWVTDEELEKIIKAKEKNSV